MSKVDTAIICGGRDYYPTRCECQSAHLELLRRGINEIHHGGASGTDSYVAGWLANQFRHCIIVPHQVSGIDYQRYGSAAPLKRNRDMLEQAKPVVVIAFKGGRGTTHMCKIAKAAGIEVVEITEDV